MHHACLLGEKMRAVHIRFNYDTFEKQLQKQIGYLNSSRKNIQFQKNNHSKWTLGSEVMIILKSTKFQRLFGNGCIVFKISSKLYFDILHYKKRKWICVEISRYIYFIIFMQTSTSSTKSSTIMNLHNCDVFLE